MNDNKGAVTIIGICFCGMLTIAFIVLKLTDYIDWSWVWIVSPIWIPVAVVYGTVAVCAAIAFFHSKRYICLFKGHTYKKQRYTTINPITDRLATFYITECTRCGKRKSVSTHE